MLQQLIKLLKFFRILDGRIQINSKVELTDTLFHKKKTTERYWFVRKIDPLQEGDVTFNEVLSSTPFPGSPTNCGGFAWGFNAGFGGVEEVPGKSAWFHLMEWHFAPTGEIVQDEWHMIHVDAQGKPHRVFSIDIRRDHPEEWYAYWKLARMSWTDPTNFKPFVELNRDGVVGANIKLFGSESGRGAQIYVNGVQNQMRLMNIGMDKPNLYLFAESDSTTHVNYLRVKPSPNPAIELLARDINGAVTKVELGEGLSFINGKLTLT